jgi:hypothetical protein
MMAHQQASPDHTLSTGGEIYRLQRRPEYSQVVVNDRYQGILAFDIWTGRQEVQIPFTPSYGSSGFIDAWCFRADGNAIIVMEEDERTACWLSLIPEVLSYDLEAPRFDRLYNLRYAWREDLCLVGKGLGQPTYNLRAEEPRRVAFVEVSLPEARALSADWYYLLLGISSLDHDIERTITEESRLVWHRTDQTDRRVGVRDWARHLMWSAPIDGEVARLAFFGGLMFVLHEYEAHAIDSSGVVKCTYPAPPGYYFSDLDTIPPHDGYPPALAIAASGLNEEYENCILVYAIEPGLLPDQEEGWQPLRP